MMLLVLLVAVANVGLATSVFVAMSRPDFAIHVTLRSLGLVDPWFMEVVGVEELGRLRKLMRVLGWLGLVAVFGCSFVSGSLLALTGLG